MLLFGGLNAKAQMPSVPVRPPAQTTPKPSTAARTPQPMAQAPIKPVAPPEDNTWWYLSIFVLAAALGGAIYWKISVGKKEKSVEDEKLNSKNKNKKDESVDADREMEWLRKNKQLIDKRKNRGGEKVKVAAEGLPNSNVFAENGFKKEFETNVEVKNVQLLSGKDLPVFQIQRLEPSNSFPQLSYSDDESVLGAIEQTHDEDEEDEVVRDLAIKILAMFRNRNSVEALSQVALYDLSSSLRVKALMTLSEFDHESVYEPILLACADPTREVRAAAARCLTKLSFNRADAWARITELKDTWRMKQSAKAAVESGLVERSFDRLVHNDYKHVYEAFALVALLIKAGETEPVLDRLDNHPDMNVRLAILHIIRVLDATNLLPHLYKVATDMTLPQDFSEALEKTIQQIGDLQMIA
jgi:HEAT repeat protein